MLKIQLCITGINYILTYIQIENCHFKLKYFTILLLLYFSSNICSPSEHKRCLSKSVNNHPNYSLLLTLTLSFLSGLFCETPPPMILLQKTSPCDQSYCQNGAQCLVVEGEPVCRCPPGSKCHKMVTVHLLGKDTYLELSGAKIRPPMHISLQVCL